MKLTIVMSELWKNNINDATRYFRNSIRHAKIILKTTIIMLNILKEITIIIRITSTMLKIRLETALIMYNNMIKITIKC